MPCQHNWQCLHMPLYLLLTPWWLSKYKWISHAKHVVHQDKSVSYTSNAVLNVNCVTLFLNQLGIFTHVDTNFCYNYNPIIQGSMLYYYAVNCYKHSINNNSILILYQYYSIITTHFVIPVFPLLFIYVTRKC